MAVKILLVIFVASFAGAYGEDVSNYEQSRNQIGSASNNNGGYGNYYPGQYPGQYPVGPGGYGGNYPGGYPGSGGYYPNPGPAGPPGAHPGCPLCDSSVYSYCSKKQAHDACCCNSGVFGYGCQKLNCNFLYANSCQEHHLITNCCCVDLYKGGANGVAGAQPVA
ncbi:uncharacterized protein LOC128676962 isoform X2 [Plodia interpunctella]|uniref:uncharacterized protein LOC128676962 isoform X2 n=1 Tax=Plodia interpunctella TaxID=58824 RepID=UPI002367A323|nr:uncharacterized protein LOC128676962 isoform X2 [Plodia interpunctella]